MIGFMVFICMGRQYIVDGKSVVTLELVSVLESQLQ